ncbi:hypothetical protein BBP40_009745, partial [Aspergillus hancockii]
MSWGIPRKCQITSRIVLKGLWSAKPLLGSNVIAPGAAAKSCTELQDARCTAPTAALPPFIQHYSHFFNKMPGWSS